MATNKALDSFGVNARRCWKRWKRDKSFRYLRLCGEYLLRTDPKKAEHCFELGALHGDDGCKTHLALMLLSKRRFDEARALLEEAAANNKTDRIYHKIITTTGTFARTSLKLLDYLSKKRETLPNNCRYSTTLPNGKRLAFWGRAAADTATEDKFRPLSIDLVRRGQQDVICVKLSRPRPCGKQSLFWQ